jgi:hypothetical protein
MRACGRLSFRCSLAAGDFEFGAQRIGNDGMFGAAGTASGFDEARMLSLSERQRPLKTAETGALPVSTRAAD